MLVGTPIPVPEILHITNEYTNGTKNAVFVDVTAKNNEANLDCNITHSILYKYTNTIRTNIGSTDEEFLVLQGQSATLRINCCTLDSGNYSVMLFTLAGNYAESPFIVP